MAKVFTITEGLENLGALKSGGQGSVYKARRADGSFSAVKILPTPVSSEDRSDPNFVVFQNEVDKLKRVNLEPNEHIVTIRSSGITGTGSLPYIEMEYIDGPDVEELLKPPYDPVFTIDEAIRLARQVSGALAHCQKLGVMHGDIKPNNIKLNRNTGQFVLLDFGLALMSDEQRRTSMRQAGAIEFMAPEQGNGELVFGTDVYSFGVVLYEALAGRVPFPLEGSNETARNAVMIAHMESVPPDLVHTRATTISATWPEGRKSLEGSVPPWLIYTVEKCLAKDPDNRFVNAVALKEFIEDEHEEYLAITKGGVSRKRAHVEESAPMITPTVPDAARAKAVARKRKQVRRQSARRRKMSPALFLMLFLCLALLAYGAYSFFIKKGDTQTGRVQDNAELPAGAERPVSDIDIQDTLATGAEKEGPNTQPDGGSPPYEPELNQPAPTPEQKEGVRKEREKPKVEKRGQSSESSEKPSGKVARYKVRSKAYFHNEPDESTRRAAFIIHWNNAVLQPQREEDGFVYIVFTNHLGQTSRGWLRIKDLVKVGD